MLGNPASIFMQVSLVGALLAGCTGMGSAPTAREAILPAGGKAGATPYSPGLRVGNTLYISGQIADGQNIEEQTKAALAKVKAIAEAAGTSMANIDKCTVFLTRQSDFVGMNGAWSLAFPTTPPARSTVIVAALPRPEPIIEIECMAHF
ncbi:RidA family protein (plasmid) [Ralstonia sp. R-29]|uniref:RidA family protein n=1 Tax=Ralstonia sp. R-29 TaxID=3404059 RepID=UPI003CF83514